MKPITKTNRIVTDSSKIKVVGSRSVALAISDETGLCPAA